MLSDEGVMRVEFWFHLLKDRQKKRLKTLEKNPKTAQCVADLEWKYLKRYDKFVDVCEPFLRETFTGEAPWIVVPGMHQRYRALTVGRHLLSAIRSRLDVNRAKTVPPKGQALLPPAGDLNELRTLRLDQEMIRKQYERALGKWRGWERFNLLTRDKHYKRLTVVWEDAGLAGCKVLRGIRLDARVF